MKMKTQHTKTYEMKLKQCLEGNLQLCAQIEKGERPQINILIFHFRILCKEQKTKTKGSRREEIKDQSGN